MSDKPSLWIYHWSRLREGYKPLTWLPPRRGCLILKSQHAHWPVMWPLLTSSKDWQTHPRAWAQLSTHCWHHVPGLPSVCSTFIHLAWIIYFISTVPMVLWFYSVTQCSLEALSLGSLQPTPEHLLSVARGSSMSIHCIGSFCACIFIKSLYRLPVRPPNSLSYVGPL